MRKHFSISHVMADKDRAEWIGRQLEDAGYTTMLQVWDVNPGTDLSQTMQDALAQAEGIVVLLSPAFLETGFTASEWSKALAAVSAQESGCVVPVRIRPCEPGRLLGKARFIDLVDLDEASSRAELLNSLQRYRSSPSPGPPFPGSSTSSVKPQPQLLGADSGVAPSDPMDRHSHTSKANESAADSESASRVPSPGNLPLDETPPAGQPKDTRRTFTLRSFWNGLSTVWKVFSTSATIAALVGLLTVLIQKDIIPLPFGPEPNASAAVSNAVLREVESTDQGEVLDIAYDIVLTNMAGDSVIVRALPLNAASREAIDGLSGPSEQRVTAESAEDSGEGSIKVPFPLDAGCIVVRVEVFEEDGDRLDEAETSAFDPYDPANPACRSGTGHLTEVAA